MSMKDTLKEYYDKTKPLAIKTAHKTWEITQEVTHYVVEKTPIIFNEIKEITTKTLDKLQKKPETPPTNKPAEPIRKPTPPTTPEHPEDSPQSGFTQKPEDHSDDRIDKGPK